MSTTKISPKILPATDLPAKDLSKQRDPRLMEAAKSFENQFIRQMISEMRKTVPKDEFIGESMADDVFRGKLDDEYASVWTDQGGIGLADMIYQQMEEKYFPSPVPPRAPGEFLKAPEGHVSPQVINISQESPRKAPVDIFEKGDKSLFVAKKLEGGFDIRSSEPLPERVNIRSPLSGIVLQAGLLEDGRQTLVIKHDNGLVSQFVHTGHNHAKTGIRVAAGEVVADLPPSQKGESANLFFGLRKASKVE